MKFDIYKPANNYITTVEIEYSAEAREALVNKYFPEYDVDSEYDEMSDSYFEYDSFVGKEIHFFNLPEEKGRIELSMKRMEIEFTKYFETGHTAIVAFSLDKKEGVILTMDFCLMPLEETEIHLDPINGPAVGRYLEEEGIAKPTGDEMCHPDFDYLVPLYQLTEKGKKLIDREPEEYKLLDSDF